MKIDVQDIENMLVTMMLNLFLWKYIDLNLHISIFL